MAKELQVTNDNNDLGPVPDVFKNTPVDVSNYTAGIAPSFPVISIKAGHWGIRFGGETTQFTEADARAGGAHTAVPNLDVVIIGAPPTISKSFYEGGYVEGSKEPPTCWSADGIRPDDSVVNKQHPVCSSCKQNHRGSKVANGKLLKACSDIKRVAIVRVAEIDNPLGPILLRVMPGSMSNYRTYLQWLAGRHRAPFMVVTRMTFDTDPGVSFPKIKFQALRGLSNDEGELVNAQMEHPGLNSILHGKDVAAYIDPQTDEEDAAGGLPPTGGLPPASSKWAQPVTPGGNPPTNTPDLAPTMTTPPPAPPVLTPEQQQIADLQAQLAAAKAIQPEPEPEPAPPVLTPEQMKIAELQAQLAEAKQTKPRGRPRSKPVGPPTDTGNGTVPADEPSPTVVGNNINNRIAELVKAKT